MELFRLAGWQGEASVDPVYGVLASGVCRVSNSLMNILMAESG